MLLTGQKLLDDLHDEGFKKRLAVRLVLPFARRDYKKAAARQPQLARQLEALMQRQRELEESRCAQVDAAAEPTALLMQQVLSSLSEDPMRRRVLERLGYLLGRWVYLIDALDDWDEDQAKGRYNPFACQAAETPDLDRGRLYEQARGTLYLTIAEMRKAYDLLGIRSLDTMMENILDLGLRQTVDAILQKRLPPREQGLVKETSE